VKVNMLPQFCVSRCTTCTCSSMIPQWGTSCLHQKNVVLVYTSCISFQHTSQLSCWCPGVFYFLCLVSTVPFIYSFSQTHKVDYRARSQTLTLPHPCFQNSYATKYASAKSSPKNCISSKLG